MRGGSPSMTMRLLAAVRRFDGQPRSGHAGVAPGFRHAPFPARRPVLRSRLEPACSKRGAPRARGEATARSRTSRSRARAVPGHRWEWRGVEPRPRRRMNTSNRQASAAAPLGHAHCCRGHSQTLAQAAVAVLSSQGGQVQGPATHSGSRSLRGRCCRFRRRGVRGAGRSVRRAASVPRRVPARHRRVRSVAAAFR